MKNKYRIKIVTINGKTKYYPQKKGFLAWKYFKYVGLNSGEEDKIYFLDKTDCFKFINEKIKNLKKVSYHYF